MKHFKQGYELKREEVKAFEKLREKYGKKIMYYDHEVGLQKGFEIEIIMDKRIIDSHKRTGTYIGWYELGERDYCMLEESDGIHLIHYIDIIDIHILKKYNKFIEASEAENDFIDNLSARPAEGMNG